MKCFHELCPRPAAYTFHSGGLCIEHASEARQNAPQLVLTAIPDNEAERAVTRPVGSDYPEAPGKGGE